MISTQLQPKLCTYKGQGSKKFWCNWTSHKHSRIPCNDTARKRWKQSSADSWQRGGCCGHGQSNSAHLLRWTSEHIYTSAIYYQLDLVSRCSRCRRPDSHTLSYQNHEQWYMHRPFLLEHSTYTVIKGKNFVNVHFHHDHTKWHKMYCHILKMQQQQTICLVLIMCLKNSLWVFKGISSDFAWTRNGTSSGVTQFKYHIIWFTRSKCQKIRETNEEENTG